MYSLDCIYVMIMNGTSDIKSICECDDKDDDYKYIIIKANRFRGV